MTSMNAKSVERGICFLVIDGSDGGGDRNGDGGHGLEEWCDGKY